MPKAYENVLDAISTVSDNISLEFVKNKFFGQRSFFKKGKQRYKFKGISCQ